MKNARRQLAVLAMASALVTVTQLPAVAQTRRSIAAGRIVSMTTAARFPSYVIYHSRNHSRIRDAGRVINGTAGDVVRFYADRFPFRGWRAVAHRTLTHGGTSDFSFVAKPLLATRYRTELFASSGGVLATSAVKKVYVLASYHYRFHRKCASVPACQITIHVRAFVPHQALRTEFRKHVYTYFGVRLAKTEPALPKWLYRGADGGHVTGMRKVAANQYVMTLHFTFSTKNEAYRWKADFCTKNTERRDGLFFPGHHGCGERRISNHKHYLG